MAKKEFKVGDVFQCGLVKLKVEKPEIGLCKGCFSVAVSTIAIALLI